MAVAAHDMSMAYSRNIAKRQLSVSDFAQSAFDRDATLESTKEARPVFLENRRESKMASFETEIHGLKPAGRDIRVLAKGGDADV